MSREEAGKTNYDRAKYGRHKELSKAVQSPPSRPKQIDDSEGLEDPKSE